MDKDTERANLLLGQIQRNQGNWAREEPGLWQERSLQPQATEGLETSAAVKRQNDSAKVYRNTLE